jgi:lipopolysaccharide export LptBFGC system permease protein LptF
MNNKTIKNVIGLCAFVLALGVAASAHAYVPGVWDPQPRVQTGESSWTNQPTGSDVNANNINNNTNNNAQYQNQTAYNRAPYFWETTNNSGSANQANNTSSTKTVATNSGTTKSTSSTRSTTQNTTSTNSNTTDNTSSNSVNNFSNLPPVVNGDTANNLGASAGFSGSFMPSSIGEWFLVLILVLIIVIIARLIARSGSQADHGHVAAH